MIFNILKIRCRKNTTKKDAILFLGSSSFTMWKDVADYFPDKTIINRAFGGSRLLNLNYYAEDLLNPYQPETSGDLLRRK